MSAEILENKYVNKHFLIRISEEHSDERNRLITSRQLRKLVGEFQFSKMIRRTVASGKQRQEHKPKFGLKVAIVSR